MILIVYSILVFIISVFLLILGVGLFRPSYRKQIILNNSKDHYSALVFGYVVIIILWVFSIYMNLNDILNN